MYYEKLALRKQKENIAVLKSVLPERLLKLLRADVENVELSLLGHTINGVRGEYLADLTPDYVKLLLPKIKEMAAQVKRQEDSIV